MKLSELESRPKLNIDDIHEYKWMNKLDAWASNHGFTMIKAGGNGFVLKYKNDPNILVKVFIDQAYLTWVNLCLTTLKGNPYVPVFKGKPVKLHTNPDIYAIRIEKLTDVSSKNKSAKSVMSYIAKHLDNEDVDNYDASLEHDANLNNVIAQLHHTIQNSDFVSDLTMWNYMMRGNQIVIIDPLG